ncbi:MAG TPA: secretin N-terminal domain-containing protein [Gemmatimonadales bacterium]|nr:secretin N-terminal domain-containing protein [Gemmatimonadales bacterium]
MTRMTLFALGAAAVLAASPARAESPPPPTDAEVTAVSILPTPGHAEIVIAVRGTAEVRDFVLRDPDRLVVDIVGATLAGSGAAYDGITRAGIRDIRYSQFRPNVVRVAIYLEGLREYRLERSGEAVRIRFGADDDSFLAWSSLPPAALAPPRGAPAAAPARGAAEVTLPSPEPAPPAAAGQQQAQRITVTWDRADIADVIAGFAEISRRTIILGKDVKGTVTAEIKNQPWPEAFAAVLATQGLQAIELPGGIIRVDAPAALAALDSVEPLVTRMVPVNYVSAGQLVSSVKSVLSKRGNVVSDTTTNSLIVTETRSRIGEVADFVKNLDVRTPQVSIQSKIIFVDRTDIQALGLQYDLGADDGPFFNRLRQRIDPATGDPFDPNTVVFGGNGVGAIANAEAVVSQPALQVVFATAIGGFKFTSFLQALQQVNLADVQAEPVITTLDNREAQIKVGEDVPVRVIDFGSQATVGAGQPRATVQFKETGILLKVTPHVTNERQIFLQIEAERSNVRALAAADLGFTIQKQNARNQLLVDDGETAVIGGLTVTSVTKTKSGIPFLVDLPIVGKLFGFSNTQEQRQDLIILVTPRVIDDVSR